MRRFLDPHVIAQLQGLKLRTRFAHTGSLTGHRLAPRVKGASSEFVDYKNYTQGDDPRRIDWKVYGRTDRYYLRSHESETNCTLWVLLDASRSMTYKSDLGSLSKWEFGCKAAIGLLYVALKNHDACGITLFAQQPIEKIAPRVSWETLNQAVELLEEFQAFGDRTNYADSLSRILDGIGRRCFVVIISDFLGDSVEALAASLDALTVARHEVVALRILDPMEIGLDIPQAENESLHLMNLEQEPIRELEINLNQIKEAYQDTFQKEEKRFEMLLAHKWVNLIRLRTDMDVGASLARVLLQY